MSEISSYVKLSPKETVLDNWEVVNDAGTPTAGEIIASIVAGIVLYFVIYYAFQLVYRLPPIHDYMYRFEYYDSYEPYSYQKSSDVMSRTGEGPTSGDDEAARESQRLQDKEHARLEADRERLCAAAARPRGGFLRVIRDLTALGVPLWFLGWPLISRPKVQGFIYLTNWRLLYFAFGQNRFRSLFDLQTVNLADVLGVHTFYSEGTFGKKQLRILIHTRFHDGLTIATGTTGTVLSRLPVLGKLLDRVLIRDTLGKDAFTLLPVLYSRIRLNAVAAATPGLSY